MAQTLLIGLGGTGSRVVNNVAKLLHDNGKEINNGEICCAVLDTNVSDNESIENSHTGIPVFSTSKAQKIRKYFELYNHLHMETWCPQTPALMEDSMIDGAAELRLKSRIAFMDCLESGVTTDLELMINDVLKNNPGSKIRIMIVSSLSGGTGSGMFIQVALWLRKFLSESQITIRGIFLLPDVFISTIEDIRSNRMTAVRHYCNAYAAIRELNAITKIKKGNAVDLPEAIKIDNLFDSSTEDSDSGKPVYDFAFFVDDKDENGVRLESIGEYERAVAQLVYMQLYAPMRNDMYSEEDNAFLSFVADPEPLYGSCGTSKAEYPAQKVKEYCAIRAALDSLTGGWEKIDSEIAAIQEDIRQREKDGIFTREKINKRAEFIKLFDRKAAVKAEETGKDRFFLAISKDTQNEEEDKQGDKVVITYSDKADDFVDMLKKKKIDPVATKHSGTDGYAINAEEFVADEHDKEGLTTKIKNDETGLEEALDRFDKEVENYAEDIVNTVFSYSMGDVKASNSDTVYGLLAKPNSQGTWTFIHPVAARYVLYKLVKALENDLDGIVLNKSRKEALTGGDIQTQFDNTATAETEGSASELLDSKKWYQREEPFFDDFEQRYAEFINSKIKLCVKYEKECLQVSVFRKLIARLNELIKQMEAFFGSLGDARKRLNSLLTGNIAATNGTAGKTLYVFASQKDKESVYQSLDLELESGSEKINEGVINAVYGHLCAEKRPSNTENQAYRDIDVINAFIAETVGVFMERVVEDSNNRSKVEMDIYTAVSRASDVEYEENEKKNKQKKSQRYDSIEDLQEAIRSGNAEEQRHRVAFRALKNQLLRMAAPFLIRDIERSDNELGTVTTRTKTFWGFSTKVAEEHSFIGTELRVNADLQADTAYPDGELYCYRAVYGMAATYVPKFNELKGGAYYTSYRAIIDEMVRAAEGREGERAYVRTPHLDMNWHRILPYITEEKQRQDELEFFHGFWLAMAYGKIRLDQEEHFYIRRPVDGGYGTFIDEDIPIRYKGKPVGKTEIAKLIEALKTDKVFTSADIPNLEHRLSEELEEMTTYVGTDVFKGLTTAREELNPISVIARYNGGRKRDKFISAALIGALEKIAQELAEHYDMERTEKSREKAKYTICKRIYDSSKRVKGKTEIFARWLDAFERCKVKEGSDTENSAEDDSI